MLLITDMRMQLLMVQTRISFRYEVQDVVRPKGVG